MFDLRARPKEPKLKLAGRDGGNTHRLAAHLGQFAREVFDAYLHPELDSEGDLFFRIVGEGHVVHEAKPSEGAVELKSLSGRARAIRWIIRPARTGSMTRGQCIIGTERLGSGFSCAARGAVYSGE
jgi:hypothetical protein